MKSCFRVPAAVAAGIAAVVSLGACTSAAEDGPATALRIGAEPLEIAMSANPLEGTTLKEQAWMPVYEGLIAWDAEASDFEPWLATDWTLSDDRKSMTMSLREDVDFSDGTHFDAEAFVSYLDALAVEGSESEFAGTFGAEGYVDVEASGPYELEFTAAERVMDFRFFFDVLLNIPIASPEAIQDPQSLATNPVGTGPYLLDELVPEVSISFVRNPDYWNPDAFDFDTVTLTVFEDRVAAFNALKSGQIDAAVITPEMTAEAEADGFALHTGGGAVVTLIIMDIDGSMVPALADVRVRQAINMAFDREGIAESIDLGFGRVSSQVGTEGQGHYVPGGDDYYTYDLEAARALMAEAGYAAGFDLVLPSSPSASTFPVQYEAIVQQSLADIGIRVSYQVEADEGAAIEACMTGEYAAVMVRPGYSSIPLVVTDELLLFPGFVGEPTFDELIALSRTGTAEEADDALAELGEYMLEQAWFAPLAHPQNIWATTPEIDFTLGTLNGRAWIREYTLVG